jgi:hypothetical protein
MGIVMVVLAVRSDDGLVVDDYYKRGLAINQVLDREARAAALGLAATLSFGPRRDRVQVLLSSAGQPAPQATLRFVHPTRAGQDQVVALVPGVGGTLEGALSPVAPGTWRIVLEDSGGTWRLTGNWHTSHPQATLRAGGRD